MRLGGRIQAAVEVLNDMIERKRPAAEALKDWGLSHRFAGSGDRAAIGNLVYDTLRKKLSQAALNNSDDSRLLVFATLVRQWEYSSAQLRETLSEDKFAPEIPTDIQFDHMNSPFSQATPDHVRADVPQWCEPMFEANFGEDWIDEAQAMNVRAPLDLRANTLKTSRDKLQKKLARSGAIVTNIARHGLRINAPTKDHRLPNIQSEAAFNKGLFEVQDEGSQIVADLVHARPGEKILDFCAGAGGKTLALSAVMENKGQIFAHDSDKHRLAPIHERLKRAATRNVQVLDPRDDQSDLHEKMDRVLVDAPCTGTGTWRRRPDAKWRLTRDTLEQRLREQEEVLSQASQFVRPGGYLIYVTCSVLPEENENQAYSFLDDNSGFTMVSAGEVWQDLFGFDKPQPWSSDMNSITLTPASTNTDGFYFAVMQRSANLQ